MPHTHNPSHLHGNKCFCTPKSHCAPHNEDSDTEAESDWIDFEGIFEEYDLGPPYKFRKQHIEMQSCCPAGEEVLLQGRKSHIKLYW